MARLRYNFNIPSGSGTSGDPKNNLVVLGVFLAIGVLFLPVFGIFGLIWCAVVGSALFKELKKQGVVNKNVEGKYTFDKNKAKTVGQRSFDEVRAYTKDTAQKYKSHVSESGRMEEKQPYKHPHTPVNYSYDACATQKRLEQLETLKSAGLITKEEYNEKRQEILAQL